MKMSRTDLFHSQVVLVLLQCLVLVQVRITDARQRKTRSPDSESDGESAVIGVAGFNIPGQIPGFSAGDNGPQSLLTSLKGHGILPGTRDQLLTFLASQQIHQQGTRITIFSLPLKDEISVKFKSL